MTFYHMVIRVFCLLVVKLLLFLALLVNVASGRLSDGPLQGLTCMATAEATTVKSVIVNVGILYSLDEFSLGY